MLRAIVMLGVLALFVETARGEEATDDLLRKYCVSHAFSPEGYGSGIDQSRCEGKYPGLPSPFTFLCVSYLDRGFPTPIDKLACAMHFGIPHLEQVAPKV